MALLSKVLFTSLILIVSFYDTDAQVYTATTKDGGKSINFEILDDNPNNTHNLYGGIGFGIDISYPFFFSPELSGRYFHNNKMMFQLDYLRALIPIFDFARLQYHFPGAPDNNSGSIPLRTFSKTNVIAAYYFTESITSPNRKIVMKMETEGNANVAYVLKIEMPTATRFGARAGLHNYQTTVLPNFLIDKRTGAYLTSYSINSVTIGALATRFQHFIIDTEDHGESERNLVNSYYFDLMIGLAGSTNFHSQFGDTYERFRGTGPSLDINRIGFRFGWETLLPSRPSSIPYGSIIGAELAYRPVYNAASLNPNLSGVKKLSRLSVNGRFIITLQGKVGD